MSFITFSILFGLYMFAYWCGHVQGYEKGQRVGYTRARSMFGAGK